MSLHVETTGNGRDLVLIHGWGMHGGIWGGVVPELSRHFRVHVADLPGYGASPACQPYDLDTLAASLADSIPAGAGVIAWSLGGLVAQRLAAQNPDKVARLMLVGSSPCFVQRPDWPHGIEAAVLQQFAEDLGRDYAGTLLRFLSLQARNGENVRTVMKYLRVALFSRGIPSAAVLSAGLAILLESDLRSNVAQIRQPVCLIHGERDMLADINAARWMSGQLMGSRLAAPSPTLPRQRERGQSARCASFGLIEIPGCAHAPFISHAGQFQQAVMEFFA
jgi:pimeloyl-[acyl-carrier protein] methyl ester esterase